MGFWTVPISQIKKNIKKYIDFYNNQRPHQSLNYQTQDEVIMVKMVKIAEIVKMIIKIIKILTRS